MKRIPHSRTSLAHRLGLGRLLYRFYHKPAGAMKVAFENGLLNHLALSRGRRAMRKAATTCSPAASASISPPACAAKVSYLTGDSYWWETIWCGTSLLDQTPEGVVLEIVDDGTLTAGQQAHLRRVFPRAAIVGAVEVESSLARRLPPEKYPLIWYYRREKPIFRKLTDIFGRDGEWRLLLDSDMLFFREPTLLLEWLRSPNRPTYMVDVYNAYGYSPALMRRLAGAPIPDLVNIGIFGFSGSLVDWDRVEAWLRELIETEGLKYNLTQAISAMHLASRDCLVLPTADYLLLPSREQVLHPVQALQHYVAGSKRWYYTLAWRPLARRHSGAPHLDD